MSATRTMSVKTFPAPTTTAAAPLTPRAGKTVTEKTISNDRNNSKNTNKIFAKKRCEYFGSMKVNVISGVHYENYIYDQVSNGFKNVQFGLPVLLLVGEDNIKTCKECVEKMAHNIMNVSFASYLNRPKLFVYVAKGYSNNYVRITQAHVYKMRRKKDSLDLSSALQQAMNNKVVRKGKNNSEDHSFRYGGYRTFVSSSNELDIADHARLKSSTQKVLPHTENENAKLHDDSVNVQTGYRDSQAFKTSHGNSNTAPIPNNSVNTKLQGHSSTKSRTVGFSKLATLKVLDEYITRDDIHALSEKDILSEYVILDDKGMEIKYSEQQHVNSFINNFSNSSINNFGNSSTNNISETNNSVNKTNVSISVTMINNSDDSNNIVNNGTSNRNKVKTNANVNNDHSNNINPNKKKDGDNFTILHQVSSGSVRLRNDYTLSHFDWYQPRISEAIAHELLTSKSIGSFYIRYGSSPWKPYILSLKYLESNNSNYITDYDIFFREGKYRIQGTALNFSSILNMIQYYTCQTELEGKDQPDHGEFPIHHDEDSFMRYSEERLTDEEFSSPINVSEDIDNCLDWWSDDACYESSLDLMRELRIYRVQFSTFVLFFSFLIHQL